MYELYQALGNSYYIQSPAKIGLVRLDEKQVCLIDSGNDKDAGRRLRKLLDEKGWKLTAIYNTHANADHNGGNRYLQQQTGCKIYAPGIDCVVNRHPILEPAFLYGGFPPKELRHKFLLAQESDTEYLTKEALPEGTIWWATGRQTTWSIWPTACPAGKLWRNIRWPSSMTWPPIWTPWKR